MINTKVADEYTIAQWEQDMRLNEFCGRHTNWFHSGCTISCPNCQNLGFYGPKVTTDEAGGVTRRYRACKFCGFWQEAGRGKPYRCVALYCSSCGAYDWTAPKSKEDYKSCTRCQLEYEKIEWASDNPNHTFHTLKRHMDSLHNRQQ